MEQVWTQLFSEFRDELVSDDLAHLETVIEQLWKSTWRQSTDGTPSVETPFIS